MVSMPAPKATEALAGLTLGAVAAMQVVVGASIGPVALLRSLPWSMTMGTLSGGIHAIAKLRKSDYEAALPLVPKYLDRGLTTIDVPVVPMVQTMNKLLNVASDPIKFDPSFMLDRSAMIVAPPGSGKSYLLGLLMVARENLYPSAPFKIGTPDTWKDGQTWMGLANCPRWLQENYLCLGYKYESEFLDEEGNPDISKAIFKEIDEMVDGLFAEMARRQRQTRDSVADQSKVDLQPHLGIIDEFPRYWNWLETNSDEERQEKIKALLCQGRGFKVALWIVAQNDAVNQIGLKQSDKESLFLVRPFKPGTYSPEKGTLPQALAPIINSMTQRRVLYLTDDKAMVQPIPQCDQEPCLNWSHLIKGGEFLTWLESLRPLLRNPKVKKLSLTKVWAEVCNSKHFPDSGNKRAGNDNPGYLHFKKIYQKEIGNA